MIKQKKLTNKWTKNKQTNKQAKAHGITREWAVSNIMRYPITGAR